MNLAHIRSVAKELGITSAQAEAAAILLEAGSTVPFIARYRKEATGTLDEVAIMAIRDRMKELKDLDDRRAVVLESIGKQGKLTRELKQRIESAATIAELEDLYLPYKPKRRTRGMIAKEKGLEPLAEAMYKQDPALDPAVFALTYVDITKDLKDVAAVLSGARDIIAEWVNENPDARSKVRDLFLTRGRFSSKVIKGKEAEAEKFKDYFEWQEDVVSAPSHRVLAARRGEKETFLILRIVTPEETALAILRSIFLKTNRSPCIAEVDLALVDGYRRLMAPSIENEIRLLTKEKADADAIQTFMSNLRQLLMFPPLKQRMVLGIDPGLRTGCKTVCLDQQGKLLEYKTIYLSQGEAREQEAAVVVTALVRKYNIEVIAIGNGTASRETEAFIRKLYLTDVKTMMVNESGASYYSASDAARLEFPDLDVSVRGAVSIARRLQDPLAELVKLDPKNIGVGQYQHDVDQTKLKQSLDDVTMSCVNKVGVDLNTASRELLMYVSGVGPALAQNVVEFRNQNGRFNKRENILNVPRFSIKAYEQAAGFLRVIDGVHPLDASAVHPESYAVVEQMAKSLNCTLKDLLADEKLRARIDLRQFVTDKTGLLTLKDIMTELSKPGRDPRAQFEFVRFQDGINTIEDLVKEMVLPGVVTNITDFGAFVDIGVHQDGLVHISQMSDKYVKHPSDVVKLHQKVSVIVKDIDLKRMRIALSMKTR
jgi:uncharacterized protein